MKLLCLLLLKLQRIIAAAQGKRYFLFDLIGL